MSSRFKQIAVKARAAERKAATLHAQAAAVLEQALEAEQEATRAWAELEAEIEPSAKPARKSSKKKEKTPAKSGRGPGPSLNEEDLLVIELHDGVAKVDFKKATKIYFRKVSDQNLRNTRSRISHLRTRGEKYGFLVQDEKTKIWSIDLEIAEELRASE